MSKVIIIVDMNEAISAICSAANQLGDLPSDLMRLIPAVNNESIRLLESELNSFINDMHATTTDNDYISESIYTASHFAKEIMEYLYDKLPPEVFDALKEVKIESPKVLIGEKA